MRFAAALPCWDVWLGSVIMPAYEFDALAQGVVSPDLKIIDSITHRPKAIDGPSAAVLS
jgi:hypothetical protein